MRRILFAVIFTLSAAAGHAGQPFSNTVGTAAICVLPARGAHSFADWTTEISGKIVRAGQLVSNGDKRFYAVNTGAGTASNAPVHLSGTTNTPEGITWQAYSGSDFSTLRRGLSVTKMTTNDVLYVSVGFQAAAGKGVPLLSKGDSFVIQSGAPQDPVYVVSGAADDSVAAQDW